MNLALLEPESNFLLGVLNAIGAVADVAADVDGKVAADGAWLGGKRVGGTEKSWRQDCEMGRGEVTGELREEYVPRPVLTASRPSQTIAQIGPLPISIYVRNEIL